MSKYKRLTVTCLQCRSEVAKSVFDRHYMASTCISGGKITAKSNSCKFCNLQFTKDINIGNHVRWCHLNPKSEEYRRNARENLASIDINHNRTDEMKRMISEKISAAHKRGAYESAYKNFSERQKLYRHSEETKELLRKIALESKHQRVCKSTHIYIDKHNRSFKFDSKWEDALADRLDELDIKWIRPTPIEWVDSMGKSRNYFPDFYLTDYDVYLDPKNSYCQVQQREKIDVVSTQINLIILSSIHECKTFNIGIT